MCVVVEVDVVVVDVVDHARALEQTQVTGKTTSFVQLVHAIKTRMSGRDAPIYATLPAG